MKANRSPGSVRIQCFLRWWVWLAAALIGAGCTHVSELREAQTLFNQASTMRNQVIFQEEDLREITKDNLSASLGHSTNHALTNPKVLYAEARDRLKRLNHAEDVRRLRRDGLLGHKFTLEALCHLELGELAEARDAAASARAEAQRAAADPGRTPPEERDRLLWLAMPGLIGLKEAHGQLDSVIRGTIAGGESWLSDLERRLIGPRDAAGQPTQADPWNALDQLKAARSEGGAHPVCTYFTMCQLSAFRYLQQACQAQGMAAGTERFNRRFKPEVTQLLRQLRGDLPLIGGRPRHQPLTAAEQQMLADWCSFFGYTPQSLEL
jgi:hypothetical protein